MSQFHFFVQFFMLVFSLFLACTKPGLCKVVLDTDETPLNDDEATNLNNDTRNDEPEKIPQILQQNFENQEITPRDDYRCTPYIGRHKFHTRSQTWNTARRICGQEGGHLAIINSKAEALVLSDIFNSSGLIVNAFVLNEAWLGMHDHFLEGEWVTVLDQPLASTGFTQWSNKWGGQPDNGNGGQNCGSFINEGTLDDSDCSGTLPFFCEKPLYSLDCRC